MAGVDSVLAPQKKRREVESGEVTSGRNSDDRDLGEVLQLVCGTPPISV